MTDVVEVDREAAEVVLEAAESLAEDIGNGRQWGWDEEAARKNSEELGAALAEFREAIDA